MLPRVLIVDDSAPLARAVSRALRDTFDCGVATNDAEALSALTTESWDAIVCDLLMPAFSGAQIYRWVRGARPQMLTKIVFVTGLDAHSARKALGDVAVPVLLKPFTVAELRDTLHGLLGPAPP